MQETTTGNEMAAEYIDKIYDCFSVTLADGESRLPGSLEEVQKAGQYLEKAREAQPDDPQLIEQLDTTAEILEDSVTRKFTGSKWILICLGIFLLFVTWNYGISSLFFDKNVKDAENVIKLEISYRENQIARLERLPKPTEANRQTIARYQKEIQEYKKVTPEKYLADWKSREISAGLNFILKQIPWIILLVLYYFVSRPPQYIINRRRKEMEVKSAGANFVKKIIFGIMGFFMSIPTTTYVTKYSDGTREETSDWPMVLFLKIVVPLIVIGILIWAMMILLPFLVLINYLRNYQFKRLDAAFTKVTDKVLGVFGKA